MRALRIKAIPLRSLLIEAESLAAPLLTLDSTTDDERALRVPVYVGQVAHNKSERDRITNEKVETLRLLQKATRPVRIKELKARIARYSPNSRKIRLASGRRTIDKQDRHARTNLRKMLRLQVEDQQSIAYWGRDEWK